MTRTSVGNASTPGPRPRSAVSALPAYVSGRRAADPTTAALASNESHVDPLPSVVQVIAEAGARANRYPDPGAEHVRSRIAEEFDVTSDEVAVGPGSVGVLQQIVSAFCDAGDEVVFAWRSFEAYPILVSLAGARSVPVPLRTDEAHDLPAMLAAITERTRVVLLCTPNNPTGVALSHDELAWFVGEVPAHVLVVVDEAYVEYVRQSDAVDAFALYRQHANLCVLRTFSKAHGLAGLRIGYAVARPEIAAALRRVALPFAVSAVAQHAAVASLDASDQMRARTDDLAEERSRVIAALREAGWVTPDSQGNFVWVRVPEDSREALVTAFADAGVLVRGYAGDGVRITVADRGSNDRVLAVLADPTSAGRWS